MFSLLSKILPRYFQFFLSASVYVHVPVHLSVHASQRKTNSPSFSQLGLCNASQLSMFIQDHVLDVSLSLT